MTSARTRWASWLRAAGAVAFAYALLLQFALAPLGMVRAQAAAAAGQEMVLCVDGHQPGSTQDQSGTGHDCADCCLNRVTTVPFVAASVSQPVVIAPVPLSDGAGWTAADARGPPKEAWSDHKTQRGPPARA